MQIEINCHSSIKMKGEITIYIDPFKIEKQLNEFTFEDNKVIQTVFYKYN